MVTAPAENLQSVVDHIFTVRRISRNTQQQLMQLLLNRAQLSPQEQDYVQRIFDALGRGILRVVD